MYVECIHVTCPLCVICCIKKVPAFSFEHSNASKKRMQCITAWLQKVAMKARLN